MIALTLFFCFLKHRRYDLPDQCRLKMTDNDIKTGKELLQEAFIMKNPEWMKELHRMVSLSLKNIRLHNPSIHNNMSKYSHKAYFRSRRRKRRRFRPSPLLDFNTSRRYTSPASECLYISRFLSSSHCIPIISTNALMVNEYLHYKNNFRLREGDWI